MHWRCGGDTSVVHQWIVLLKLNLTMDELVVFCHIYKTCYHFIRFRCNKSVHNVFIDAILFCAISSQSPCDCVGQHVIVVSVVWQPTRWPTPTCWPTRWRDRIRYLYLNVLVQHLKHFYLTQSGNKYQSMGEMDWSCGFPPMLLSNMTNPHGTLLSWCFKVLASARTIG